MMRECWAIHFDSLTFCSLQKLRGLLFRGAILTGHVRGNPWMLGNVGRGEDQDFARQQTPTSSREEEKTRVAHREEWLKELLVLKCDPSRLEIGKYHLLLAPQVPFRVLHH